MAPRVSGAGARSHVMHDPLRIALPLRHGRDQAYLLLENGLPHRDPREQGRFRENLSNQPEPPLSGGLFSGLFLLDLNDGRRFLSSEGLAPRHVVPMRALLADEFATAFLPGFVYRTDRCRHDLLSADRRFREKRDECRGKTIAREFSPFRAKILPSASRPGCPGSSSRILFTILSATLCGPPAGW